MSYDRRADVPAVWLADRRRAREAAMSDCEQIDWFRLFGNLMMGGGVFLLFMLVMIFPVCWFWKFITWLSGEHPGWFG